MSFADVVFQVRTYAPFFASVSGAATYELAETQLNGQMPACAIVPTRYTAAAQTNLTSVYREVVEIYDLLVALDNTTDRAGTASTAVAFDAAFAATRGALDGWVPQPTDGSSYLYGFAFMEAEPTTITGPKSFYSIKYQATHVFGPIGSFLQNPLYLNNVDIVSPLNPIQTGTIDILNNGGTLTVDLSGA